MIIYLDQFKKYQSVIKKLYDKDHPFYTLLYLDFKDNYAYVTRRESQGRIRFFWEREESDDKEIQNVFVDINCFMPLLSLSFDSLKFNGEEFSYGKNKFKIQTAKEKKAGLEGFSPEFRDYSVEGNEIVDLLFTQDIWDSLHRANKFAGNDDNTKGIFISQGRVFSTDLINHYVENLEKTINQNIMFILSTEMYNVLSTITGTEVSLYKREKCLVMSVSSEIDIVVQNNNSLKHIVNNFAEFDKRLKFDSYIEIDRRDLIEVFKFMNSYAEKDANVYLVEDSGSLLLKIIGKNSIVREVKILNITPDLFGINRAVKYFNIKQAIDITQEGSIKLYLKADYTDMNVLALKSENKIVVFKFMKR